MDVVGAARRRSARPRRRSRTRPPPGTRRGPPGDGAGAGRAAAGAGDGGRPAPGGRARAAASGPGCARRAAQVVPARVLRVQPHDVAARRAARRPRGHRTATCRPVRTQPTEIRATGALRGRRSDDDPRPHALDPALAHAKAQPRQRVARHDRARRDRQPARHRAHRRPRPARAVAAPPLPRGPGAPPAAAGRRRRRQASTSATSAAGPASTFGRMRSESGIHARALKRCNVYAQDRQRAQSLQHRAPPWPILPRMATDQRPVELILARGLMSNLTTPAFLVDPDGTLVFFNEAAGELLGLRYEEAGPMTAARVGHALRPARRRRPPDRRRRPAAGRRAARAAPRPRALQPSARCAATSARSRSARFRSSAMRECEEQWRSSGTRTRLMRVKVWGARGSIPCPGPDTVRYGGNTSLRPGHARRRRAARARRGHRDPQPHARRRRRAAPASTSC